jgi:ribosomal protein S18 acetylase RimI-like enzyme
MMTKTTCIACDSRPQYEDRQTGQYLCLEHARLEVVAAGPHPPTPPLRIRPATEADGPRIVDLALYFWDETEVDCFDRQYDVATCPAFLACEGDQVVGVLAYALEEEWNALVVLILNLLPGYQGRGGGRRLLDAARAEAARRGLGRLLVVTSNDDLPALALYQRYGFRLVGILPGREVEHHGAEFPGFAGIPVRDEIQLEYRLAS